MPPSLAKTKFAIAALLALASTLATAAHARPVAPETFSSLAQKADILVVAEVTCIDHGTEIPSPQWNIPILQKHATLRILRGLKPADSTAVDLEELTLQFPAYSPNTGPLENAPLFPTLSVGQVALFPLKQGGGAGSDWQFVNDEDIAMLMPAARRTMAVDAPDARMLFFRELAGAFTYGDYDTMARAGRYLDMLGTDKESPVEPVFALIRQEIGDSSLKEDARWVQIAVADYIALPYSRTTFADLLNGTLPASKGGGGLRLAALSLRKAGKFQLDQRILQLLINHQNDPGKAPGIAHALALNYPDDPAMLALEREALKEGKPAALQVADMLISGRPHPLAATAAAAASAALEPEARAQEELPPTGYTATTRAAVSLLLRLGSDDDFETFLEQIDQASQDDPAAYQAFLTLTTDATSAPTSRILNICRYYIEDPTPMSQTVAQQTVAQPSSPVEGRAAPQPTLRLCDLAALTVARVAKQDFGLRAQDPEETRDAAIAKTTTWLSDHH